MLPKHLFSSNENYSNNMLVIKGNYILFLINQIYPSFSPLAVKLQYFITSQLDMSVATHIRMQRKYV